LGGGFDLQSRGQTTFFFEAFESGKTFLEKVLWRMNWLNRRVDPQLLMKGTPQQIFELEN